MLNIFKVLLSVHIIYYCHGLPVSVDEDHSSVSQNLHLYDTNSTDDVNYQLTPLMTQHRRVNEDDELGREGLERNGIISFFTFLFDLLANDEDYMGECMDDEDDDGVFSNEPSDPGYQKISHPSEPTEAIAPKGLAIPFFKKTP